MSVTIGTLAGSSGLGNERQVVRLVNGDLWAFGYTGTQVLATWWSQDNGVSWTAGATLTLSHVHSSEGRNLAAGYRRIGTTDVAHVAIPYKSGSSIALDAIRATIASTTLTFHTAETAVSTATTDGAALFWAGSGIEIGSDGKVHIGNGWADAANGQGDVCTADSTADAGSAEQMTPVTWTGHTPDTGPAAQVRSMYMVDLGGGSIGLIADDGASSTTAGGLSWYTWNGSAWSGAAGNQAVTGAISGGIDKNDWGAVALSASDVHVVYRDNTGAWHHRRWNGTSWGAGQAIPAQANQGSGGTPMATDGLSVWLCCIDTDAANTVRYVRWTSAAFNGIGDAWDAWLVAEGSSATRNWLGCTRDVVTQTLLIYWTEGSTLKSVAVSAPTPIDPPGVITRDAISALGSSTSSPLTLDCTTTQPTPGDKICVAFGAFFAATPGITSVVDNTTDAGGPRTLLAGPSDIRANNQAIWLYWLDLPVTATWTGDYKVVVTWGAAVSEADGGIITYAGAPPGAPTSTNHNSGTGTTVTTGSVSPGVGNALYFAAFTDSSGGNPASIAWSAPFVARIQQLNGSIQQIVSIADAINFTGAQNASATIDNVNWNAAIMAWPALPAVLPVRTYPRISGLGVG